MRVKEAIDSIRYRITTTSNIVGSGADGNAFEDLEMAIEALEKQIPKQPKYQGEHEKCPTCGSFYIEDYCAMCGQKIDRD